MEFSYAIIDRIAGVHYTTGNSLRHVHYSGFMYNIFFTNTSTCTNSCMCKCKFTILHSKRLLCLGCISFYFSKQIMAKEVASLSTLGRMADDNDYTFIKNWHMFQSVYGSIDIKISTIFIQLLKHYEF